MKTPRFHIVVFLVSMLFSFTDLTAQKKNGTLEIIIVPCFQNEPLLLHDKAYVNANNDTLYVDEFKFYLSDIMVSDQKNGIHKDSQISHLIDSEDSLTCHFKLLLPEMKIEKISFGIGVDSIHNVSGALSGDLDPIKGMYWAWNTGYIAAKLSGRSKVCKTAHHEFDFHIGGYLSPNDSYRRTTLNLKESVQVISGKTSTLNLYADIAEWFKGRSVIDLSKTNHVVIPSQEAMKMADNYVKMLTVKTIQQAK